jgi:hypothetical protein
MMKKTKTWLTVGIIIFFCLGVGIWYIHTQQANKDIVAFFEAVEGFEYEKRDVLADGTVRYTAPRFTGENSQDIKSLKVLNVHALELEDALPLPVRMHLTFEQESPLEGVLGMTLGEAATVQGEIDYTYANKALTVHRVQLGMPNLLSVAFSGSVGNLDLFGLGTDPKQVQNNMPLLLLKLGQAGIQQVDVSVHDNGVIQPLLLMQAQALQIELAVIQQGWINYVMQLLSGLDEQQKQNIEQQLRVFMQGSAGLRLRAQPEKPILVLSLLMNSGRSLGQLWQQFNVSVEAL